MRTFVVAGRSGTTKDTNTSGMNEKKEKEEHSGTRITIGLPPRAHTSKRKLRERRKKTRFSERKNKGLYHGLERLWSRSATATRVYSIDASTKTTRTSFDDPPSQETTSTAAATTTAATTPTMESVFRRSSSSKLPSGVAGFPFLLGGSSNSNNNNDAQDNSEGIPTSQSSLFQASSMGHHKYGTFGFDDHEGFHDSAPRQLGYGAPPRDRTSSTSSVASNSSNGTVHHAAFTNSPASSSSSSQQQQLMHYGNHHYSNNSNNNNNNNNSHTDNQSGMNNTDYFQAAPSFARRSTDEFRNV